jgi:hypothetical protein
LIFGPGGLSWFPGQGGKNAAGPWLAKPWKTVPTRFQEAIFRLQPELNDRAMIDKKIPMTYFSSGDDHA